MPAPFSSEAGRIHFSDPIFLNNTSALPKASARPQFLIGQKLETMPIYSE
jgi:hypothetical protein